MFVGDAPGIYYFEIVLRVLIIYVYAVALLRLLWNQAMKNMNFLDYFVVISLWSSSWDAMFYPSVPLLYALLVITFIIGVKYSLDILKLKSTFINDLIQANPARLIKEWKVDNNALAKKRMKKESLFALLRLEWIKNTWEVEVCYLEPTWWISVYTYKNNQQKDWEDVLPPEEIINN